MITLPEGMMLDQPTSPGGFGFGDVGDYKVDLKQSNDGKQLVYHRELTFGRDGKIAFPVTSYPLLKKAFDEVYNEDNHTVTLRAAN